MKNNFDSLNQYTDPFSEQAKKLSLSFDIATINKNVNAVRKLLDDTKKALVKENEASKAMIYYSLGTAYDDFAKLTENRTEETFQKVLYCFRKSIKLIEQDEYTKEIYRPYVLGLKEILYTNYANALDHCGRKLQQLSNIKKCYHSITILEWL